MRRWRCAAVLALLSAARTDGLLNAKSPVLRPSWRGGQTRQGCRPLAQTVQEHLAENALYHSKEIVCDTRSSVRDCITRVRAESRAGSMSAQRISELGRVWVADEDGRFGGYVGATELLLSEPSTTLKSLTRRAYPIVQLSDDLDEAMVALSQAGVAVAPVVDEMGAFVGALSPAEILREIKMANTEDVARYAASGSSESYFGARSATLVWNRASWLLSLLMLQSFSSAALGSFAALLEKHLALALFLTMLTGTAGNAGNQSSAMVIRGLATGEINPRRDLRRVAFREAKLGLPLALLLGVASFARVYFSGMQMKYVAKTALVVGLSTTVTVLSAILVGTGAPLLLDRVGIDPCNCASPALATVVDLLGVLVLCSVGAKLLPL